MLWSYCSGKGLNVSKSYRYYCCIGLSYNEFIKKLMSCDSSYVMDIMTGEKQRSCLTLRRRSPGQTGSQGHSMANRFHWSDSVSEQWWDRRASSDPMSSQSGLLLPSPTGVWEKKRKEILLLESVKMAEYYSWSIQDFWVWYQYWYLRVFLTLFNNCDQDMYWAGHCTN